MACLAASPAVSQEAADPTTNGEVQTLIGQLGDSERTAKTRLEAASLLLNRGEPQAAAALRAFLLDAADPGARKAVAEAIALHGGDDEQYIEPLQSMLTGEQADLRAPAARALITYKDHDVFAGLLAMTLDAQADKAVRLVLIDTLQTMPDKRVVNTLVHLVEDSDETIRAAAAATLAKLTGIRSFGNNAQQWKTWWARNRDKPPSLWLSDLADSLARSKAALEEENRRLRARLAKALGNLYAATPVDQRTAMVGELLKDSMADVRLAAVGLLDRLVLNGGNGEAAMTAAEVRQQIQSLMNDESPDVRAAAAQLTARLGDRELTATLLGRLAAEQDVKVRQGLVAALGQLRDPAALDAVVQEIASGQDAVATTAAAALARIADKSDLTDEQRAAAAAALSERFRSSEKAASPAALREELVTAMGVMADPSFAAAVREALADSAATVRLAAVGAMRRLNQPGSDEALAPLIDDADRGVRRAAISALGALGGRAFLSAIVKRTDAAVEIDADVRQQAWDVVLKLLADADVDALRSTLKDLAGRADATDQRIRILQMLVTVVETGGEELAVDERLELGLALLAADRPAEAAGHLQRVYEALAKTNVARAAQVWDSWVDALLAADDPTVVEVLAENEDDQAYGRGLGRLRERLRIVIDKADYADAVALVSAVLEHLPHRITVRQRKGFEATLTRVKAMQQEADAARTTDLIGQLTSTDAAERTTAAAELQSMGERAVEPLLTELRKLVAAEETDTGAEKAILEVVQQVAPDLAGYDIQMNRTQKLKVIDGWRQ
jgi:HEAT repeat protein